MNISFIIKYRFELFNYHTELPLYKEFLVAIYFYYKLT